MVVLDKTIVIHAPPSRVFDLVTRVASAPAWWPGLVRAGLADPHARLAPGVAFTTVREDLGMRLESSHVTTALDAPRRFSWRQRDGDFQRFTGTFEVSPDASGARVRLRVELELPFVLPRLTTEDEIHAHYSRRLDLALYNLKDAAEIGALSAAGRASA